MTKQEFIDYIKSLPFSNSQTSFMRSKKNSAYPQRNRSCSYRPRSSSRTR